jgi:hypothetical protein
MDVQFLTGIKYRDFSTQGNDDQFILTGFHSCFPQMTNIVANQIPKEY